MSNCIMLIPSTPGWEFESHRIIDAAKLLWPSATVAQCSPESSSTHLVDVTDRALWVYVGPGYLSMHGNLDLSDCGRFALAAMQTAPPSVEFVYMDQGNNHALGVTASTPLTDLLRLWDAPPLRMEAR